MRLLLLAIELLAITSLVMLAVVAYAAIRHRQLKGQLWTVETRSVAASEEALEGMVVELRRAGEPPERVAFIPSGLSHEELSDALAEADSEAKARAAALNAGRSRVRR
jgi:hypothetical protein